MENKRIIQRNLSLNQKYDLIRIVHIPLIDGSGCTCSNCGKLIANIATIKGLTDGIFYLVGSDCLETFILNNHLLEFGSVGSEYFNQAKNYMPKIISIKKDILEFLSKNLWMDRVLLEYDSYFNTGLVVNYFKGSKQVYNDYFKYNKNASVNHSVLLESLKEGNKNVKFELVITH